MSLTSLSARDRRALRFLALTGLPMLLYFGAFLPYRRALTEARERIESERQLLAGEQALLAASERYPTAYRAADSALIRTTPRLFNDPDDVLATAQLTSYVAGQALSSRAYLQEAESREAQRLPEGIRALEVDIQAESDLEGLLRFLDALERGQKLIIVDQIAITRGERPQGQNRPPISFLTMKATVRGFALVDSPNIAAIRDPEGLASGESR